MVGTMAKIDDSVKKEVPELRFKGFTDDWEKRKLSDIADKAVDNRGKTPTISEDGNHPLLEVASLGNGAPDYSKVTKYLSDETFMTELRAYIKEGDILFSTVGSIGLVSLMDTNENAAIAQNIVAFRANEKYDSKFLYAMLSKKENQHKAQRIVMGAVQPSIKVSQLVDVDYCVTENMEEQRKLGEYFLNLDNLIALYQRKLDLLKEQKKGFLQKMFPKNGAKVPELRFAGFTDDWEERKLGDVTTWTKGQGLTKEDLNEERDGSEAVHYADLYKFSPVMHNVIHWTNSDDGRIIPDNSLLFPASDVTPVGLARASTLRLSGVKAGGDVIIGQLDESINSSFMSYQINANSKKILPLITGTTVKHVQAKSLATVSVSITNMAEQTAIAGIFERIDNLIALHQRKLDLLKEQKKGFLQKMFV